MPDFEKFWISQAAIIIKNNKCLILEFSDRPGYWDIPGGRIDKGKAGQHHEEFSRELKEEINLDKFKIVDIVDYDTWYVKNQPRHDGKFSEKVMCAIVFLIGDLNTNDFELSHEHKVMKWITEEEIDNYTYLWPNTARMIENGFKKYNQLKK